MPNVILHHRLFPSLSLVDKCEMVVTIQGTVGFDALLRNKQVLLLGKAMYESIYGLEQMNGYKDLQYILKTILSKKLNKERQNRSLLAFLAAWDAILYKKSDYQEFSHNKISGETHRLVSLINQELPIKEL